MPTPKAASIAHDWTARRATRQTQNIQPHTHSTHTRHAENSRRLYRLGLRPSMSAVRTTQMRPLDRPRRRRSSGLVKAQSLGASQDISRESSLISAKRCNLGVGAAIALTATTRSTATQQEQRRSLVFKADHAPAKAACDTEAAAASRQRDRGGRIGVAGRARGVPARRRSKWPQRSNGRGAVHGGE